MPDTAESRRALGARVRQRREALGLKIEEAATRAGFGSVNTWLNIEHGRRARGLSYSAADKVLGWGPGSCKAILAGEEPAPEEPRLGTRMERLELILAAIEDPNVDWDVDSDVLDLMAKKVRAALKRAQTPGNQDRRDVG